MAKPRRLPRDRGVSRCRLAREVGPDTLAIAEVLAQPWADVVLSGAVTTSQFDSNAAAAEHSAETGLQTLDMPQDPAAYWAERRRLAWS